MKKIIAVVTSLVMLCGMTSCDKKNDNKSSKKVVGVCMPSSELLRWNSDGEYLKNVFEKAGYEVKLTFSNNSATRQNNDILGLLNEGVDLLLIAAGFVGCEEYTANAFGVKLTQRGVVETLLPDYKTNVNKVFTAGDMHRGQSLVVWAIAEGRECAREIDEYLMGYSNM